MSSVDHETNVKCEIGEKDKNVTPSNAAAGGELIYIIACIQQIYMNMSTSIKIQQHESKYIHTHGHRYTDQDSTRFYEFQLGKVFLSRIARDIGKLMLYLSHHAHTYTLIQTQY